MTDIPEDLRLLARRFMAVLCLASMVTAVVFLVDGLVRASQERAAKMEAIVEWAK